jgi:hypothetical protein
VIWLLTLPGSFFSTTADYSSLISDLIASETATQVYTTAPALSGSTKGGSSSTKKKAATGLSLGAKIGIAVGVILLLLVAATVAIVLICLRKRKNSGHQQLQPPMTGVDGKNNGFNGGAHAMGAIPNENGAEKRYTVVTTSALPGNGPEGYAYVDANGNPIQMAYTPSPAPAYPPPDQHQQQQFQPGAMWGVPAGALAAGAGAGAGAAAYYGMQHQQQAQQPQQPPQPTGSPSPHAMNSMPYQPSTTPHPQGPPPMSTPPSGTVSAISPQPSGQLGMNAQPNGPPPGYMNAPHDGAVELPLQAEHVTGGSPASGGEPPLTMSHQAGVVPSLQVFEMGESNGHHVVPGQQTSPHQMGAQPAAHVVPNSSGQGPVELAGSS